MDQLPPLTILLVDANDEVRSLMAGILTEGGYHVVEATDTVTALDVIALGTHVDLLVADVLLPGMSGFDLASRVTALCKVPVLFLSPFALTGKVIPGPALQKPFTPSGLLETVHGLLPATEPAGPLAGKTLSLTASKPAEGITPRNASWSNSQISVLLSLDAWQRQRNARAAAPQVWHLTPRDGGMVQWRVSDLLKERQWSAYRLKQESRLAHSVVYRITKAGRPVERVDGDTLDALCRTFGVGPGELFEYVPGPEDAVN
jgi:CheY-like chemotaxis protein/DNA-binding Xre family transcriptional regulator